MNYYGPREIRGPDGRGTGKFRMTVENDGHVRAVGHCYETLHEHDSAEEASDCYRDYIKTVCDGRLPGGFKGDMANLGTPGTLLKFYSSY